MPVSEEPSTQRKRYAGLAYAYGQGAALQTSFGNINTDNPDLTKVRAKGAKIIHFHGWATS